MTGVRPGWYWQIMWRFVSPVLMVVVIGSSIYFMFTNKPTYAAWDGEKVENIIKLSQKIIRNPSFPGKKCQEGLP